MLDRLYSIPILLGEAVAYILCMFGLYRGYKKIENGDCC